jgi:hypothetical protein
LERGVSVRTKVAIKIWRIRFNNGILLLPHGGFVFLKKHWLI